MYLGFLFTKVDTRDHICQPGVVVEDDETSSCLYLPAYCGGHLPVEVVNVVLLDNYARIPLFHLQYHVFFVDKSVIQPLLFKVLHAVSDSLVVADSRKEKEVRACVHISHNIL